MNRTVRILPRAEADIRSTTHFISERSARGAGTWLRALERTLARLEQHADECGEAEENARFDMQVKQALFKTKFGRVYRLVFTIGDDEVRILRVRGAGQAPIEPGDV